MLGYTTIRCGKAASRKLNISQRKKGFTVLLRSPLLRSQIKSDTEMAARSLAAISCFLSDSSRVYFPPPRLTATDGTTADYLYLDYQPIAKTETNTVYFIHTDHLGTPITMTDSSTAKVWEIETRPFGDNPTITGAATLNLRFPGQYFDA